VVPDHLAHIANLRGFLLFKTSTCFSITNTSLHTKLVGEHGHGGKYSMRQGQPSRYCQHVVLLCLRYDGRGCITLLYTFYQHKYTAPLTHFGLAIMFSFVGSLIKVEPSLPDSCHMLPCPPRQEHRGCCYLIAASHWLYAVAQASSPHLSPTS
jgi:hypothetical protein